MVALLGAAAAVRALTVDGTRAPRGTTVAGLPVGGMPRDRVAWLVAARASEPADTDVTAGRVTVHLPTEQLGVGVDVGATARAAVARPLWTASVPWAARRRKVPLVLVVDEPRLRAATAKVLAAADVAEGHGDLRPSGSSFVPQPPTDGQRANAADVRRALLSTALTLPRDTAVRVPVQVSTAHLRLSQLQALASTATVALSDPVTFRAGARSTVVAPDRVASLLTVDATEAAPSGGGHGLTLGLRAASSGLAAQVATALSRDPAEPRLSAPPATAVLTTQGSASWSPVRRPVALARAGRPGQQVTSEQVQTQLTRAVQAAAGRLPVITVVGQPLAPTVSDLQARQVNALIGTFTTPFRCCQPRVTNIRRIAATVDGTLLAPGEVFSLNGIVGRRTRAKGYVDAPYIRDGELSTDIGGGVSQFATTTFNAAFFAGLHIVTHQPHSFYISRYPPGREATVNYPDIDLKFINDTGGPLLVRAATTATSLTVNLYGRGDGRQVQAITGDRVPVPGYDFRIAVTRIIKVPGRPTRTERFETRYDKPPAGE